MNINKNSYAIIGGGFSAFVAKTLINKKCYFFFPENHSLIYPSSFFKAPSYEIKKFFSSSVMPYVTLMPKLKSVSLHAYQLKGGNTNIWGGFINIKKLPSSFIKLLNNQDISAVKLDNNKTGSSSNSSYIYQLQEKYGEILNVANFLSSDESFFLHSISVNKKIIKLYFMSQKYPGAIKIFSANNVILALGVVDLIDLLFRSKIITDSCCLELSEYCYRKHIVFFKFINSPFKETKKLIIRFNLMRAFCHMLGIQKTLPFNWLFNLLPFYVEQHFYGRMNTIKVDITNGNLVNSSLRGLYKKKMIFGDSIHYCNLKINGMNINAFLKNIHPGLIGLGMAFVKQSEPGPISNDIAMDAIIKFKRL